MQVDLGQYMAYCQSKKEERDAKEAEAFSAEMNKLHQHDDEMQQNLNALADIFVQREADKREAAYQTELKEKREKLEADLRKKHGREEDAALHMLSRMITEQHLNSL